MNKKTIIISVAVLAVSIGGFIWWRKNKVPTVKIISKKGNIVHFTMDGEPSSLDATSGMGIGGRNGWHIEVAYANESDKPNSAYGLHLKKGNTIHRTTAW
jgi:hypothetical protein